MLYFGVVGALAISVIDHYECVHFCKNCPTNSTDVDNRDLCTYVRVPFWVLLAMSALAVAFILVSCVCCVSRSCKNVRIIVRRETQRSVEHYWVKVLCTHSYMFISMPHSHKKPVTKPTYLLPVCDWKYCYLDLTGSPLTNTECVFDK